MDNIEEQKETLAESSINTTDNTKNDNNINNATSKTIKKYIVILIILCIILIALVCGIVIQTILKSRNNSNTKINEDMQVLKDYTINITSDNNIIGIGEEITINIESNILDSKIDTIKLVSSDENVLAIEDNKVVGVGIGKSKIYAQIDDIKSNEIEIECIIKMDRIELNPTSLSLIVGDVVTISAIIFPEDATNKELVWKSSDENVASIENGNIKANTAGNCKITISNEKENIVAECEVEVKAEEKVEKNSNLHYVYNVPYLQQYYLGYPTGCEAVSAVMAARYSGYNISIADVVSNTPTDDRGIWKETITTQKEIEKEVQELVEVPVESPEENTSDNENIENNIEDDDNTNSEENTEDEKQEVKYEYQTVIKKEIVEVSEEVTYAGNPFSVFVGHPTKDYAQNSYGCFAQPIVVALGKLGVPCTNISNCSNEQLLSYIDNGKPVVVWGTAKGRAITTGVTWTYPDNSGTFTQLVGEHCMVLVGYDDTYVYLNDPAVGRGVSQTREVFFRNFDILYRQAIIIN